MSTRIEQSDFSKRSIKNHIKINHCAEYKETQLFVDINVHVNLITHLKLKAWIY